MLQMSAPADIRTLGQDLSGQQIFQHARGAAGPIVEAGVTDFTTYAATNCVRR